MTHDPITRSLNAWAWVAWALIALSVLGSIFAGGLALPKPQEPPQYTEIDASVVVLVGVCIIMIVITQIWYPNHGSALDQAARWMSLAGWSVIELRFVWVLMELGDIPIHPMPMVALGALAISHIMRSMSIWHGQMIARSSEPTPT